MEAADVKNKWENNSWGRKQIVKKRRAALNDFDRFKIMLAKIKEKISILRENETLLKENERLNQEKETFLKTKDLIDIQIRTLTKSLEAMQKDIRDKENQVLVLKQSLKNPKKELNDCRAEIISLKMHIEGSRSGNNLVVRDVNNVHSESSEKYVEEIMKLQMEIELLKEKNVRAPK